MFGGGGGGDFDRSIGRNRLDVVFVFPRKRGDEGINAEASTRAPCRLVIGL